MIHSILIFIVAAALITFKRFISNIFFHRITIISLFYSVILLLNNIIYIQTIGSGTGLLSSEITQTFYLYVFFILIIILLVIPRLGIFNPLKGIKVKLFNLLILYSKVISLPSVNRSKDLIFNLLFILLFLFHYYFILILLVYL